MPCSPYYLHIVGGIITGFIPFSRVLAFEPALRCHFPTTITIKLKAPPLSLSLFLLILFLSLSLSLSLSLFLSVYIYIYIYIYRCGCSRSDKGIGISSHGIYYFYPTLYVCMKSVRNRETEKDGHKHQDRKK